MNKTPKKTKCITLLETFDEENRLFSLRVGKDRSIHTYNNMVRARTLVALFLEQEMKCHDIALTDLHADFIQHFCIFLSVTTGLSGGSIWLNSMLLKGIVQRAHRKGLTSTNPFADFHIAKNIRERQYLTEEEVGQLAAHPFSHLKQRYIRDLFLFAVFTGMSFVDIRHLKTSNLCDINGHKWIVTARHKTGVPFQVRLMEPALEIIRKYIILDREYIFDRYEYDVVAKGILSVFRESGIRKHITFHCARHTFAVMALNGGMPIESVSSILGHSNITTTQIYTRITLKKLNGDFGQLEKQLTPLFNETKRRISRKRHGLLPFFPRYLFISFFKNIGLILSLFHGRAS